MNKIAKVARGLARHIGRFHRSRLEDVVALCADLAAAGDAVARLKQRGLARADVGLCHAALRAHLEDVAMDSMELLLALGKADFEAAFTAEYERAAKKHPGMTLDSDRHTDESRFYALAEEVGEVRAARAVAETRRDVGALDNRSFRVALFKAAGEASPVFGWGAYIEFAALAAARLEALGHSDPATEVRNYSRLVAHPESLTEKQDRFIPLLGAALSRGSEEASLKLGGTAFAYATDILRQEKK